MKSPNNSFVWDFRFALARQLERSPNDRSLRTRDRARSRRAVHLWHEGIYRFDSKASGAG